MIKNNKINQVISNYRKVKSINLFISNLLILLILLLSSSIFFIVVERFVFFSVDTRVRIVSFFFIISNFLYSSIFNQTFFSDKRKIK